MTNLLGHRAKCGSIYRSGSGSFIALAISLALLPAGRAAAQESNASADDRTSEGEIVVTAQKRAQAINTVPMTITAATGEQLTQAGVRDVSDLAKITPSFSAGVSNTGIPVYTLRGVGTNDVAIEARPAVAVYLDEAPITYAVETRGAGFDLERVEVLKGPQGTLFGNNSTGGAINYIARKPTDAFEVGGSFTYGRFNQANIEGYVSGSLSSTLKARVAVEHRGMGGWQKSLTRNDTLGRQDFTNGRLTLAWEPTSSLRTQLTVSHWVDRSDTQATQLINVSPQIPAVFALTALPGVPLAKADNRSADWDADRKFQRDDTYTQVSFRADQDLSDKLTLTSLTNYLKYKFDDTSDGDGTAVRDVTGFHQFGDTKSFSQELRLTGTFDKVTAIGGLYYANDKSLDNINSLLGGGTVAYSFTAFGAPLWQSVIGRTDQNSKTYAAFGNLEFALTPEFKVQGGLRYSKQDLNATACSIDSGDNTTNLGLNALVNFFRSINLPLPLPPVAAPAVGQCASFNSATLTHALVTSVSSENNVSWRAGVQYEPSRSTLLYANVSKGYKSGSFPVFGSPGNSAYKPIKQESVLAYEAGFKVGLLDRALQLNGAVFYSDYRDKQLLGTFIDQTLGPIQAPTNIPKSRIWGTELQLDARPTDGLTITLAGSYVDAQIRGNYTDANALGVVQNFNGTQMPYAPKLQFTAAVRYEQPVSENMSIFFGGSVQHQSKSYAVLGEVSSLVVNERTLTDLQIGLQGKNKNWSVFFWGKNVFNEHYWNTAVRLLDTSVRYAGMPATYGITLRFNNR